MSKYGTVGSVQCSRWKPSNHAITILTQEKKQCESLLQGAYEDSIKTRKDFEQLEVENPVRHGCLSKQSTRWREGPELKMEMLASGKRLGGSNEVRPVT